uniref:TGF-beta family profile domain-containing protein n=1 Tax=Neogobius melanostomus TaxID=47308 RepID=A0A8C6TMX1_9GOBI
NGVFVCVAFLSKSLGFLISQPDFNGKYNYFELLDALFYLKDLPRRPTVAPHKKAPQFMLDLFNAVSRAHGTPKSQKELLDGNIVRSFEDKGEWCCYVFHLFNLSSFGKDERLNKAEFRWFREKQTFACLFPCMAQVDLYEVLDSRVKPWRGNLITTRLVPLYTQGWEVFNITQVVSKWIRNSEDNNGILMVTTLPSGNWMDTPEVSSPKHKAEESDTNAYLVIFSDENAGGASNKSYLGEMSYICQTLHLNPLQSPPAEHHDRRGRPAHTCQRVPLFVDFEEIGWSGWIISPRGYNAHHCRGSCPFPLGGSLRATNHATVRSIMHALKLSNDEVGAPCCVPDKLQSISLLYFDDEENVVLKQYDDMVALSCGCH